MEDGIMTGKAGGKIRWETNGTTPVCGPGDVCWNFCLICSRPMVTTGQVTGKKKVSEGPFYCHVVDDGARGLLEAGVPACSRSCSECQT